MVTHQLQVKRRTGKVRWSKTNILPLCYATNQHCQHDLRTVAYPVWTFHDCANHSTIILPSYKQNHNTVKLQTHATKNTTSPAAVRRRKNYDLLLPCQWWHPAAWRSGVWTGTWPTCDQWVTEWHCCRLCTAQTQSTASVIAVSITGHTSKTSKTTHDDIQHFKNNTVVLCNVVCVKPTLSNQPTFHSCTNS